jgi:hypothetical protein
MIYCQGIKPCHRNKCTQQWVWVMRLNSKAFTKVNRLPALSEHDFPENNNNRWQDTIIQPVTAADSGIVRWHTTGWGDCRGWFTYELYKDNFYPVVLLKEWSHYGGCRAGGYRRAVIKFQAIPGVLYYEKNRILVN